MGSCWCLGRVLHGGPWGVQRSPWRPQGILGEASESPWEALGSPGGVLGGSGGIGGAIGDPIGYLWHPGGALGGPMQGISWEDQGSLGVWGLEKTIAFYNIFVILRIGMSLGRTMYVQRNSGKPRGSPGEPSGGNGGSWGDPGGAWGGLGDPGEPGEALGGVTWGPGGVAGVPLGGPTGYGYH